MRKNCCFEWSSFCLNLLNNVAYFFDIYLEVLTYDEEMGELSEIIISRARSTSSSTLDENPVVIPKPRWILMRHFFTRLDYIITLVCCLYFTVMMYDKNPFICLNY